MDGGAGSVHVRRHAVSLHAYGTTPSGPTAMGTVLDHGFAERFGAELTGMGGPEGYWVIRRLDVRAVVSQAWSPRAVSVVVARVAALRLSSTVAAGSSTGDVLWWPDRAAFLACFLLDAAAGRADGRWEYAQFADVPRSPGARLLRLAREEPSAVLEALLGLDDRSLRRVVEGADGAAAADVLAVLSGEGGAASPRRDLVLQATADLARTGGMPTGGGAALLLALAAARTSGAALSGMVSAAREIADLDGALTRAGRSAGRLLEAISSGSWAVAFGLTAGAQDAVLPFVAWSPDDRLLLGVHLGLQAPVDAAGAERLHTALGGMFLLLPLLDELCNWSAATATWPALDGVPAPRLARLLVMTAVLGGGGSAAPVTDRVLRLALAVPSSLPSGDLLTWWEQLPASAADHFALGAGLALPGPADPAVRLAPALRAGPAGVIDLAAEGLLRALARRLPGMAGASAAYLLRNALDLDATVTLEPGRAVVELGSPPLGVLLSLAGVNRGSFHLEGTGGLTWTVSTRE